MILLKTQLTSWKTWADAQLEASFLLTNVHGAKGISWLQDFLN